MLFTPLFAILMAASTTEMIIPEGTILSVVLNETLSTARLQENEPVLFTLAEDVRAAGHRGPVLIPRGSSVVGRVVTSERAGHLFGRAAMDIQLQEIITPTGEVYDGVSTKIIDVGKKKGEKAELKADGNIQGPVHRGRDTFLLLFPPTTIFQLLATPKRGPDVVIPVETRLSVKLMSPIYVEIPVETAKVAALPAVAAPAKPNPNPVIVMQPVPQAVSPVNGNSLDVLVAPVALYPDVILRDLFRAATHPVEAMQANLWVHQLRDASGSLPPGGYNDRWDPSVKALTGYPDVLQRLTTDADWMARLGTVYATQPGEVLNAVQRLRIQSQIVRNAAVLF